MARGLKVLARLFQIEQVKILEKFSRSCLQIKNEATEAKSTLGDLKILKLEQFSKQLSLFLGFDISVENFHVTYLL